MGNLYEIVKLIILNTLCYFEKKSVKNLELE